MRIRLVGILASWLFGSAQSQNVVLFSTKDKRGVMEWWESSGHLKRLEKVGKTLREESDVIISQSVQTTSANWHHRKTWIVDWKSSLHKHLFRHNDHRKSPMTSRANIERLHTDVSKVQLKSVFEKKKINSINSSFQRRESEGNCRWWFGQGK